MDFQLPQLGEGVYEAEMVRWLVRAGDTVHHGQGLMEVMTDKATMEVPSPFAGTVTDLRVQPGQTVHVGDHILTYTTSTVAEEIPPPAPPVVATPVAEPTHAAQAAKLGNGRKAAVAVKASPSVRLLARKLGIDLAHVRGSGPGGRVLLDDLNVPETPATPGEHAAPPALLNRPTAAAASRLEFGVAGTRIKLAGVRRRIAEHLVEAKHVIPHFTYVDECDLTDLVRLRASLREPFEKAGIKLTYL